MNCIPPSRTAGPSASQRASDVTHAAALRMKSGSRTAWDVTTSIANTLVGTTQGILSLRLSEGLNELLQDMVNRSASIYDRAIDSRRLGIPNRRCSQRPAPRRRADRP